MGKCRLPGRERNTSAPSLKRVEPLFESGYSRVGKPGVNISLFSQAEELLGMVHIPELIRRGHVDRQSRRSCGSVALPSAVQRLGHHSEIFLFFRHTHSSLWENKDRGSYTGPFSVIVFRDGRTAGLSRLYRPGKAFGGGKYPNPVRDISGNSNLHL